jgi:uncharacterized protein YecE (DUF72 family)
MLTKHIVSLIDVAKEIKKSGVTVRHWWREGKIPTKRAKRGKKHVYLHNSKKLQAWCDKQNAAGQVVKARPSRAGQISRRRQADMDKLFEMLKNRTKVTAKEKEEALCFFNCMFKLLDAREGPKPRPVYPLLEGIEALFRSREFLTDKKYVYLDDDIERLPTRS